MTRGGGSCIRIQLNKNRGPTAPSFVFLHCSRRLRFAEPAAVRVRVWRCPSHMPALPAGSTKESRKRQVKRCPTPRASGRLDEGESEAPG